MHIIGDCEELISLVCFMTRKKMYDTCQCACKQVTRNGLTLKWNKQGKHGWGKG